MNLCDHISLCQNPWPMEPDGTADTCHGWCDDNPSLWGLSASLVDRYYSWRTWVGRCPNRYPHRMCKR